MSPDWFDPLGLRGSKLDPFAQLAAALKGTGFTGQSMGIAATTVAQRLVGRTIEIDHDPPIKATVERIDDVRPAPPIAAMNMATGEMPMWKSMAGRLTHVSFGDYKLESIDLAVEDVSMSGTTRQQLGVRSVRATGTISAAELQRGVARFAGDYRVRIHNARIEVTDRRVASWLWFEVGIELDDGDVVLTPVALRAFEQSIPMMSRLRRPIRRPAPWLPPGLTITRVAVVDDHVEVDGHFVDVVLPVDVTSVLMDLRAEGTRSALRIVLGDW